jgi:peptide/nickel transport system permease protein
MIRYAIKRLLYIIPSIGIVMLIMFMLSKANHDDPAESLCRLEGITPGHPSEAVEYSKHYKNLSLDKPTFYFGVQPSFYHPDINGIVNKQTRIAVQKLTHQKIGYESAIRYIHDRDSLIKVQLSDTSMSQKHRFIQSLQFVTDVKIINEALDSFPSGSPWQQIVNNLNQGKLSFYYPRFAWNGINNQFHGWASHFVRGDFGTSLQDGQPISTKVSTALKYTLLFLIISLLISTSISVITGSWSGFYEGGWIDKITNIVWLVLYSIPTFWLASMLILYCTSDRYGLPIFTSPGNWNIDEQKAFLPQIFASANMLILPIICMIANDLAYFTRMTRNNVISQKTSLYSTIAYARGIKSSTVLWKYILPNSLIAMSTVLVSLIPAGISGSIIIEIVFNIPGMGRLLYDSINHADWPAVYCIVMIISIVTICMMAFGDIIYMWINPKIKMDE